ncbi:unnamed protein product, partial [Medioppia subpectinata]
MFFSCNNYVKFRINANIINQIPGPDIKNILIGNLDLFYSAAYSKRWFQESYRLLIDLCKSYQKDGVFRLWIGPINPVVVLLNADNVEELLSNATNISKAYEYKYLRPWLGFGLLTSTGSKWQSHRKLLTPAFHFKILENFLPTIINQQNIMQSLIDKQIEDNDGVVDDMRKLITNYTLDAICETAMGVTVRAQQNPNSDYVEAIRRTFAVSILRFIKPWLWPDFTFYLSSLGRLLQRRLRILHGFTDSVIKERKTEILDKIKDLNNNDVNNNYKNGKSIGDAIDEAMTRIGAKRQLVFLDTLLNYHFKRPNHMSELDVRSHVDTFMFGGHDTTASSLMFTIMLIPPFTYLHEVNSSWLMDRGIEYQFLHLMSGYFNFTYRLIRCYAMGAKQANNTWTGLLGLINQTMADIALGGISLTDERSDAAHFSQPHIQTGCIDSDVRDNFMDMKWLVVNTALRQQCPVCIPHRLRLLMVFWLLATLVLTSSYSGCLYSLMAFPTRTKTINTVEELATAQSQHTIQVMATKNGAYYNMIMKSNTGVGMELKKGLKGVSNTIAGINMISKSDKQLAIISFREALIYNMYKSCATRLHIPPDTDESTLFMDLLTVGLRKDFPYKNEINKFISGVKKSGLMDFWK